MNEKFRTFLKNFLDSHENKVIGINLNVLEREYQYLEEDFTLPDYAKDDPGWWRDLIENNYYIDIEKERNIIRFMKKPKRKRKEQKIPKTQKSKGTRFDYNVNHLKKIKKEHHQQLKNQLSDNDENYEFLKAAQKEGRIFSSTKNFGLSLKLKRNHPNKKTQEVPEGSKEMENIEVIVKQNIFGITAVSLIFFIIFLYAKSYTTEIAIIVNIMQILLGALGIRFDEYNQISYGGFLISIGLLVYGVIIL